MTYKLLHIITALLHRYLSIILFKSWWYFICYYKSLNGDCYSYTCISRTYQFWKGHKDIIIIWVSLWCFYMVVFFNKKSQLKKEKKNPQNFCITKKKKKINKIYTLALINITNIPLELRTKTVISSILRCRIGARASTSPNATSTCLGAGWPGTP